MSTPFDPSAGLVIVTAEIRGPSAKAVVQLAVDTGATRTLLNAALPATKSVAGLVGLDFFRGLTLTIDFKHGRIGARRSK